MGVGKEQKMNLEEFFDDVRVSDRDAAIRKKLTVKFLSIMIPEHSKY